jgi:PAS domain S-box-containing protein
MQTQPAESIIPLISRVSKVHRAEAETELNRAAIQVLLVESDRQFARSLRQSLAASTNSRIELVHCERLDRALEHLATAPVAAILLDLDLPDGRGLEVIQQLQSRAGHLPVILLADFENETLALRAVREGAQDYLVKSRFEGRFLSRVIRYAIERKDAERRLTTQCAITRVLAESVSLPEGAQRILAAAGEGLGWEAGVFWTPDSSAQALRAIAVWRHGGGFDTVLLEAFHEMPLGDEGLFGRVYRSGEAAWSVDPIDVDESCQRALVFAGVGTALGVPVAIHQRVLGVIGLLARGSRPHDGALLQMMATAGGQIGQFLLRKQVESTLAEEQNLLRTLIDTLPDAIYVKDVESRFVLANLRVARLMGTDRVEDLYGKRDAEFVPVELAERSYEEERGILESGHALINQEEPYQEPSGRRGWLLTTKAPLRDLQGRLVGIVGIGRDITQRREEEEAHRSTEARLQAILDNTTAVVYLKDTQGRYLLANRQFESLFRIPCDKIIQHTDAELFPPEIAAQFRANDERVLAARAALEFEETAPQPDGLHTYISIKFPLWDAAGMPCAVCGISTDITERKRVESQLVQAEKFKSIGTLAAGVAHEVKNPLQTILMGVTYLDRWVSGANGEVRMVISEIRDAIRRADSIIRGLVEFAAANQPEVRRESLNAIIEASLALVRYQLTRTQVAVVSELDESLPRLWLDRNKIEQALINLFLNAIQAMPGGGTLTVRTCLRPGRGQHGQAQPPTTVVAEVEDTGPGIPEAMLPRIFDPFYTTKPTGVGTGLGLSVTRRLIEAHGGAIAATNCPGAGARFTITLASEPEGEI